MGQFALAAGTFALSTAAAAQQYRSGKQTQIQFKQEAKQEGDQAKQREIDRKRNLLRAIASQNAAAGAAGVEFDGSLANLARVDIEDAASDLLVDRVNTSRRGRVLAASGREAGRAGAIQAGASLLDSADQFRESQL